MQIAARDNAMASEARGAFNETPLWVRCPPWCFAGKKVAVEKVQSPLS